MSRGTVLDLFSGIGGFALACERVGLDTVAFCEIDPFCRAVLAKHWPGVPLHGDIRELDPAGFRGVDLICGGFPCQDISAAGKGAGIAGPRSGLWLEMARIIGGARPARVLVENVPALRTRGIDRVLSDLEALGYAAWPFVVGAWAVGAPHKRDRVWIVAHARGNGQQGRSISADCDGDISATPRLGQRDPYRANETLADAVDERGDGGRQEARREAGDQPSGKRKGRRRLADAGGTGLEGGRISASGSRAPQPMLAGSSVHSWPARPGEQQHEWEEPRLVEFPLGRATDGLPGRLVRSRRRNNREALKAYGNSVVPQVVEAILRAML